MWGYVGGRNEGVKLCEALGGVAVTGTAVVAAKKTFCCCPFGNTLGVREKRVL